MKGKLTSMFLFLVFQTLAQDITVNWGLKQPKQKDVKAISIIGGNKDNFFVVKKIESGLFFSSSKTLLEKYETNQFRIVSRGEIVLKSDRKARSKIISVFYWHNKNYLFYTETNVHASVTQIKIQPLNETGQAQGAATLVAMVKNAKNSDELRPQFGFSTDSNSIFIIHRVIEEENINFMAYHILDNDLNSKFNGRINFPFSKNALEIAGCVLCNNGLLYFLFNTAAKNVYYDYLKSQDNFLITVNLNDNTQYKKVLNIKSLMIGESRLVANQWNEPIVSGILYIKSRNHADYSVFIAHTKADTVSNFEINIFKLDNDFLKQCIGNEKIETNYDFGNYHVFIFENSSDSGYRLILEKSYIETVCSPEFRYNSLHCNYYYNFDDILVLKWNQEAQFKWGSIIPKEQSSVNDGGPYAQFALSAINGKTCFLFNDNRSNLNQESAKIKSMDNPNKSVCKMVLMNDAGQTSNTLLFHSDQMKIVFKPKVNFYNKFTETIIYGEQNGIYCFGKVSF